MTTSRKAERNREFLNSITPLYYDYLDGVTGRLDENGVVLPNASQGLSGGLTWVRLDGSREGAAVLNGAVNPYSPNIPVETAIDRRTGKRQVLGVRFEEAVRLFGTDVARAISSPTPPQTTSDNLLMGKVEPDSINGGLSIYVRSFQLPDSTTFPLTAGDSYYDLTTEVGALSTDTGAMAIVYVLNSDHQIYVEVGDEHGLAYPYSQADADAITLPAGAIPLAAIVIKDGQTDATDSFTPNLRFFDRRIWLGNSGDIFVSLAPDSLTRNTVTPTGDYPALVLTNYSAQTTTLFQVNIAETDPPDDMIGAIVDMTQTLTSASAFGTTALDLKVTMANGTANNTSSGNRALQLRMFATGTSGTISNLLVTQQSMTISGGVAVTTVRSHRINDATVSGGSTLTNNAGLVLVERSAGTNNVHIFMGALANPTGNWAIYSQTSYASSHLGNLGLGLAANVVPTEMLSLSGQASRKVWMERNTTSNTAGNSLTIQAGGATSGATNKAGGDLTLQTGTNTGNVAPAHVRLMAGVMNPSSGTGDNSNVDRLRVGPTKVLTNNSATTIVNATLASNTMIGGVITYSIQVFDGTNVQTETGMAIYSGINKAGAFTCSITEVNSQQDTSSGTLATTWAISGANPAAISVNANSSLTPSTGYPRITYNIENFAQQSIAIA